MKNLPKRLWLQVDSEDLIHEVLVEVDFNDLSMEDVTWSCTHQYDNDVPYVLETSINKFEAFNQEHKVFTDKKFADVTHWRGPLKHLAEEVEEAIESGEKEEFADMFMLLLSAFRLRFGNQHTDYLISIAREKLEINKQRSWKKVEGQDYYHHVKSQDDD